MRICAGWRTGSSYMARCGAIDGDSTGQRQQGWVMAAHGSTYTGDLLHIWSFTYTYYYLRRWQSYLQIESTAQRPYCFAETYSSEQSQSVKSSLQTPETLPILWHALLQNSWLIWHLLGVNFLIFSSNSLEIRWDKRFSLTSIYNFRIKFLSLHTSRQYVFWTCWLVSREPDPHQVIHRTIYSKMKNTRSSY